MLNVIFVIFQGFPLIEILLCFNKEIQSIHILFSSLSQLYLPYILCIKPATWMMNLHANHMSESFQDCS